MEKQSEAVMGTTNQGLILEDILAVNTLQKDNEIKLFSTEQPEKRRTGLVQIFLK